MYDHAPGELTPVVLLHGGGQNRHSWGALFRRLEGSGHEVVSMDLRGHGDSDWTLDGYRLVDYGTDVETLLRTIDRPSVIVGASMGGLAGLHAAARRPDLVAGLVLVDITTRPRNTGTDRILEFMQAHAEGFEDIDHAVVAVGAYLSHRERPPDREGLSRNLRQGPDGRWRWHWDPRILDDSSQSSYDRDVLDAAARTLRMPVLLVRGEHSDVVSTEDIEHFCELVPQTTVAVVAGAHHMVAGDRNDAFADVIAGYLDDEGLRDSAPAVAEHEKGSSMEFAVRDTAGHYGQVRPDQLALTNGDTGHRLTWHQLDRLVGQLAGVLRDEYRIERGHRVGLIADSDPKVFALQFACMRLGAVFVPLNWRLAFGELEYQCSDCGISLLVHDATWSDIAGKLAAAGGFPTLEWAVDDEPSRCRDLMEHSTYIEPQTAGAATTSPTSSTRRERRAGRRVRSARIGRWRGRPSTSPVSTRSRPRMPTTSTRCRCSTPVG